MKRIILLITTAIMVISVVAGCGGNSKNTYSMPSSNSDDEYPLKAQLLGAWVSTSNNITWTYKDSEYIIDYSSAFPGDNSSDAVKVRKLPPTHISYTIEDNYIIFNMGGVSYRNKAGISGDTLVIIDSVSGKSSVYTRKK